MSKIHINRNGNPLGVFTLEEVKAGLSDGKFLPTDLAWHEGMPEWKPIGELPELTGGAATSAAGNSEDASDSMTAITTVEDGPAWEKREELGLLPAMIETIKAVLLDPVATFSSMKKSGGLANPLLYYVIPSVLGGIMGLIYNQFISKMGGTNELASLGLDSGIGLVIGFIALPLLLIISAFISSGVMHLCLRLIGAAQEPFEATFRVIMYASGSTAILQLVPFCGGSVAGIWALVLMVIGFTKVHNISTGKAVLAVLLPTIVCCALIFIIIMVAGGMGAVAAAQAAQ